MTETSAIVILIAAILTNLDELFGYVLVYRLLRPNKNIHRLGHRGYICSDYDNDD
jgi:hypothetical protein